MRCSASDILQNIAFVNFFSAANFERFETDEWLYARYRFLCPKSYSAACNLKIELFSSREYIYVLFATNGCRINEKKLLIVSLF